MDKFLTVTIGSHSRSATAPAAPKILVVLTAVAAILLNQRETLGCDRPSAVSISKAKLDTHGFLVHEVQSPFQKGQTKILILTPDRMKKGKQYPVIYVLPVEAGCGTRWGHGLREIKKLNLHNKWDVIFVLPTFSHLPWYCDHPTDPTIRQEEYLLKVVIPFVDKSYPVVAGSRGRLLVGFSKSGWGAFTLLLRNPEVFGRSAAWDAPLNMAAPNRFGMGPIFGTQKNFENYKISSLLKRAAAKLRNKKRLALIGYSNFRKHHLAIHAQMKRLRIPHAYVDVRQGKHHWNGGWLTDAVGFLLGR